MGESFQTYSARPTSPCYQIDKDTTQKKKITDQYYGCEHGYKNPATKILQIKFNNASKGSYTGDEVGFGVQGHSIYKSMHMIQIINKMKGENHMTIYMHEEKTFDKIQHLFTVKTPTNHSLCL